MFRRLALLAPLFPLALLACERPPSPQKASEWTPADHDRAEEQGNQASGTQAPPQRGDAGDQGQNLVELAWQNNCAACHGAIGKGDGPSGPMVQAKDLTNPDWQDHTTDDQMIGSIANGKGRMPKFDLPPKVVQGLVARIRAMKGR